MHLMAGNVVGYAVYYDIMDLEVTRKIGVGRAIIDVCTEINTGMPEHDMELGTDLRFMEVEDVFDEDDDEILASGVGVEYLEDITFDDAAYLLAHMPALFLEQRTEKLDDL